MPTTHPEIFDLHVSPQKPQVNAPQGLKIKATKLESYQKPLFLPLGKMQSAVR